MKSPSEVGEHCGLKVFGEKDTKRFLAFDRSLRQTIEQRDTARLAALVLFPLRVNDDKGSIYIHDARSLDGEFDRVFPEAIRKAILKSTPDTIWCNYAGLSYGEGSVWINVTDKGFFLASVNLPEVPLKVRTPKAELACFTDTERIVLDRQADDTVRYRAWKLNQDLYEAPVKQIEKGKGAIEGTGPCAHWEWTFESTDGDVQVMEPECGDDGDSPKRAQAEIVSSGGKDKKVITTLCF